MMYTDEEAMDSLFAFIDRNSTTKEQFETLEKELTNLGWLYDISGYDYWTEPENGEWYLWSREFKSGEEYEAYLSIELLLDKAGVVLSAQP